MNSRSYRVLTASLIYLVAIAGALTIATLRSRAKAKPETTPVPSTEETERPQATKPFFSLSTHRTYGTSDNPRLWVDYQGVDHLDFRVYQVKDPRKFFTQLKDPHQMGKKEEEVVRTPLNVSDYARVPLLNPDLLVTTWREPLPPLENEYDKRMIPLGKRSPGVYLVEAVANDLRAYTVVVVTDLIMIDKTTQDGELLVYTVDRKTGEPRPGAQVEIVREKKIVASGVTDNQGILRTKIEKPKATENKTNEPAADTADEEADGEGDSNPLLILARQSSNFAISDLGSFYFGGIDSEEDGVEIKGYIYTDRPVYRPS